jgi:hypothetical protein
MKQEKMIVRIIDRMLKRTCAYIGYVTTPCSKKNLGLFNRMRQTEGCGRETRKEENQNDESQSENSDFLISITEGLDFLYCI